MKAVFLSDVHLRDGSSLKTQVVIRFLQEVASQYDQVFILGDLFDAWPGTNAYLVRTFRPVIQALKDLVEEGCEVHYVEGNHDFRLGSFFSKNLGIKVHTDGVEQSFGGKRAFLVHGDLGNPNDKGYRALRYVLRNTVFQTAFQSLPQEFVHRFASKTSQLSRKYQTRKPHLDAAKEEKVREIYRKTAQDYFEMGFDVVVMGHTHIPDDFQITVQNRPCRYFNTGDWLRNFTYLEFDGTDFYTKVHPVKDL